MWVGVSREGEPERGRVHRVHLLELATHGVDVVCSVALQLLMPPLAVKMQPSIVQMINIRPLVHKMRAKIKQHEQATGCLQSMYISMELKLCN